MKNLKRIFVLAFVSIAILSCLHIEKRTYRPGYYVEWNNKPGKTSQQIPLAKSDTTKWPRFDSIQITVKAFKLPHNFCSPKPIRVALKLPQKPIKQVAHRIPSNAVTERSYVSQNRSGDFSESWTLSLGIGASIVGLLSMRKRGRRISRWASKNKKKAQILLGLGLAYFGIISIFMGWFNQLMNKEQGIFFLITSFLLALSGYILNIFSKGKYLLNRIAIALFLGGILGSSYTTGQYLQHKYSETKEVITENNFEKNLSVKAQISMLQKTRELPKALIIIGKILLTILMILLSYMLYIGVLYLSCELSCSGAMVMANLVLVTGTIGIIGLLGYVLFRIWKPKNKRKQARYSRKSKRKNIGW